MVPLESNVVCLARRRLVVRMIPFIDAERCLQMTVLAWLELAERHELDFLSNPTVYGRHAFVFEALGLRLVNETFLRRRLERPDGAIGLGRSLMEVVGPVDRPRALQFESTSDGSSGQFVMLPVTIGGVALNVLRLAKC